MGTREYSETNSMNDIDWSTVRSLDEYPVENPQDRVELDMLALRAREYLVGQRWCKGVEQIWHGYDFGLKIAVFLVKVSLVSGPGHLVWVVVGDVPPAYLGHPELANPIQALDGYAGEMQAWVKAAKAGMSLDDLIPVNAPATLDNVAQLESRLKFINEHCLVPNKHMR